MTSKGKYTKLRGTTVILSQYFSLHNQFPQTRLNYFFHSRLDQLSSHIWLVLNIFIYTPCECTSQNRSSQICKLEICNVSVLDALRTELTRYYLKLLSVSQVRDCSILLGEDLRAAYQTRGKLTILENCASNLILGNYSLTLLCLFILAKAFFSLVTMRSFYYSH